MKRAMPTSTWFGGIVWRPSAWRGRPRTMTIRGNPGSRIRVEGGSGGGARARMIRMLDDGFVKLFPRLIVIWLVADSSSGGSGITALSTGLVGRSGSAPDGRLSEAVQPRRRGGDATGRSRGTRHSLGAPA